MLKEITGQDHVEGHPLQIMLERKLLDVAFDHRAETAQHLCGARITFDRHHLAVVSFESARDSPSGRPEFQNALVGPDQLYGDAARVARILWIEWGVVNAGIRLEHRSALHLWHKGFGRGLAMHHRLKVARDHIVRLSVLNDPRAVDPHDAGA